MSASFRPSCTTESIRGGAKLWHVKELLGHEHLDTLQPYAKLTIADLREGHDCGPQKNAREVSPPRERES